MVQSILNKFYYGKHNENEMKNIAVFQPTDFGVDGYTGELYIEGFAWYYNEISKCLVAITSRAFRNWKKGNIDLL